MGGIGLAAAAAFNLGRLASPLKQRLAEDMPYLPESPGSCQSQSVHRVWRTAESFSRDESLLRWYGPGFPHPSRKVLLAGSGRQVSHVPARWESKRLQCSGYSTNPACRGNQILHQQIANHHQGWQRGSGGTSRVISNPLERETYPCPSQPVSIRRDPSCADVTLRGVATFTNVIPSGLLGHPGEGHTSAPLHIRGNSEDIR